ncbi:MAG: tRNA (guanosine(37)-N1)-methyltransferase TrmD [Christensenellaceae bacterium]|jgi:tRNA (guanine37-N1)-methyltransferase|nr:tRNA (guanosine(37)-N1)-methyltransferase TrmD [Christensenellaceae bacterium]
MRIKVLTLFPEMFAPLSASILGRAEKAGLLSVETLDIRAFTNDKHRRCDDYPFGGGPGMVMTAQPLHDAFLSATRGFAARRVLLSPKGRTLTQRRAMELAKEEGLILLCGHYEGVDQRAIDLWVDEEISIGDYVLTGGELAAMVLIDALARHVPGVLGDETSAAEESFMEGLLEYPQYTRPAEFLGLRAPEELLSGAHKKIEAWRREKMLTETRERRPDLFEKLELSADDRVLLGLEERKPRRRRSQNRERDEK